MSSIKKRGKNSWQIIVSCGYDTSGKKLTKTTSVKRAEGMTNNQWLKELDKLALEFERAVEKGTVLDASKITFAEFIERWLSSYAEKELEPKTLFRYKEMLTSRIIPALGHIRLDKLQPINLIDFYDNLQETGMRLDTKYVATPELQNVIDNQELDVKKLSVVSGASDKTIKNALKGLPVTKISAEKITNSLKVKLSIIFSQHGEPGKLSSQTILHHHRLISSILQDAVEWQVLFSNPASRVKPPKVDKKPIQHYDEEQTKDLLEALEHEEMNYKAMVLLDIFSGLRLGELMGLNWHDVDFENNTINIIKASQYLSGVGVFEKRTKNETSIRKLTLPGPIMDFLKDYRKWWNEKKVAHGDVWQKSDRLFVTWDGKPLFTYTLTNWFPEFLKRHNLPKITPHGLRHTMASLLDSQGLEVSAISKRLGHARISTTSNIYTHVFKKADTVASDILEKTLLPKKEQDQKKLG